MGDEPDVTEPQIHVVAAKEDGNEYEAPAGVYEAVYARSRELGKPVVMERASLEHLMRDIDWYLYRVLNQQTIAQRMVGNKFKGDLDDTQKVGLCLAYLKEVMRQAIKVAQAEDTKVKGVNDGPEY
ncbi:MAG: hypothetical protein [Caudoviricetes sp.]|nr:MAG: hypothetical protein [Caudoviricetes sp.]